MLDIVWLFMDMDISCFLEVILGVNSDEVKSSIWLLRVESICISWFVGNGLFILYLFEIYY